MFYQVKVQAATNWSCHLKYHQTFDFFQITDFYAMFTNYIFPRILKIISSTLKNLYMRLILCEHGRQNPTKVVKSILQQTKCLTASHFRFNVKIKESILRHLSMIFLNFFSRTVTSSKNKKSLKISLSNST